MFEKVEIAVIVELVQRVGRGPILKIFPGMRAYKKDGPTAITVHEIPRVFCKNSRAVTACNARENNISGGKWLDLPSSPNDSIPKCRSLTGRKYADRQVYR